MLLTTYVHKYTNRGQSKTQDIVRYNMAITKIF